MEDKKNQVRVIAALKGGRESTGIGCILREIYGSRLVFDSVSDVLELKSFIDDRGGGSGYDLVVFDRWPVGMDGGVLGALISAWRGVPFVMIIDEADDVRVDKALRAGVSAILKTPLTCDSVVTMVPPLSGRLDRRKRTRAKLNEQVSQDSCCIEKLYGLLELSRAIGVEIEIENLLDVIVEKTTDVMDAERTTLFLYDDSRNELKSRIAEGLTGVREIRLSMGHGIAGDVARQRKTVNISDAYSDARFNIEVDRRTGYRTRSVLCSPIIGSSDTLMGVIQVINKKSNGDGNETAINAAFNEQDERLLEILCGHAAVALERIKLTEACLEKRRIEESLRVAHDIQMNMVPKVSLPLLSRGIDLHVYMKAAREVGGDFYDFFFVDKDRLCLTIGDVSGKGVPAALFMVKAMTLLKSTVQTGVTPNEALTIVNRELCLDNRSYMFVTVFLGIFDISTGHLRYSNGGHNPPYLLGHNGIVPVTEAVGPALGILEGTIYESAELEIAHDHSLLMYTDGIEDSRDVSGGFFSIERLEQLLYENRLLPAERLVGTILDSVNDFSEDAPQADDITILDMRKLPPPRHFELTIEGGLENIPAIMNFIAESAKSLELSEDVGFDSQLAVEEACTNIIKYAYDDPEQAWINLIVTVTDGKFVITIKDNGQPFDYDSVAIPDLNATLTDRKTGGMGVYFIKQIMEEMSYEHRNGSGVLTLIKHLKNNN
ncbi:stage II sporulation protein E [Candidatus Magnetobacterium bavaricum]|uniref:Stage II sporulation protein E n=1 Tax=Candidatus Magnetobacterium bavaricum TaxID=29290 RepID=A0A0F3H2B7_9BACT|nr:stage II sporulation protein E [Candidatus Magnetobacterium bavaricum]